MINKVSNQQNFTSTFIPYKSNIKLTAGNLDKYFELKGFGKLLPDEIRAKINLNQVGIGHDEKGLIIVGKDREADNFIGRIMKKEHPSITHIEDTPETVFDGQIIDMMI